MQQNELRVGNWVNCKIYNGNKDVDIQFTWEELKYVHLFNPIPLTPEILEKTNFKKVTGKDDIWEDCKLSYFEEIYWIPGMYFLEWDYDHCCLYHATDEDSYWEIMWVRSLHELQNVIFAITKKELEINF